MKRNTLLLLLVFTCLTLEVAGQEVSPGRQGGWHWQVNTSVQLLGRGWVELHPGVPPTLHRRNERYGLGFAAWRDLNPNWAVGLGLNYHVHQLRYGNFTAYDVPVVFPQPYNFRHSIGAMPSIRWQQAADRGVFAELAASLRLALGETGREKMYLVCITGKEIFYDYRDYIYEPRFAYGQAIALGYLFPVANGGAISLRASALCEVRQRGNPLDENYPEKPWRIQPGLELGWRWGK